MCLSLLGPNQLEHKQTFARLTQRDQLISSQHFVVDSGHHNGPQVLVFWTRSCLPEGTKTIKFFCAHRTMSLLNSYGSLDYKLRVHSFFSGVRFGSFCDQDWSVIFGVSRWFHAKLCVPGINEAAACPRTPKRESSLWRFTREMPWDVQKCLWRAWPGHMNRGFDCVPSLHLDGWWEYGDPSVSSIYSPSLTFFSLPRQFIWLRAH